MRNQHHYHYIVLFCDTTFTFSITWNNNGEMMIIIIVYWQTHTADRKFHFLLHKKLSNLNFKLNIVLKQIKLSINVSKEKIMITLLFDFTLVLFLITL